MKLEMRIKNKQWNKGDEKEEWFHDGYGDFIIVGKRLLEKGFTEEEVLDILGTCYNVAANEYGD